ncbi:hypothetical protein AVEN_6352-1 [Araneus ventricosus]|uniref:Uncharacterized protein n=1 Tax=Araneus ventricosus TaxID=182803 RepID=A0A4Y2HUI3_ARAVE|nr:hypothetical protein AVEN_6352-1 [Araneus ventricosus]
MVKTVQEASNENALILDSLAETRSRCVTGTTTLATNLTTTDRKSSTNKVIHDHYALASQHKTQSQRKVQRDYNSKFLGPFFGYNFTCPTITQGAQIVVLYLALFHPQQLLGFI